MVPRNSYISQKDIVLHGKIMKCIKILQHCQQSATFADIFDDLKNQLTVFLIYHYVKRIQASHIENLIRSCDGKTVLLQVDVSENASLLMQNEIQSAH